MIRNEWGGAFSGGLWRVGKYLGEKTRARGWRCEVTMHYGYDVIAFDCGLFSRSQRVSFLFRLALAASDSIIAYRPYNMGDFGVCTSHVKGRNSQWQTTSRVGGWWLALLDSAVSLAYIFIYIYVYTRRCTYMFRGMPDSNSRKLRKVHSSRRMPRKALSVSSWFCLCLWFLLSLLIMISGFFPFSSRGHVFSNWSRRNFAMSNLSLCTAEI